MKQCFTMLGCEISQEKKERKNPTNSKHNTQKKSKKRVGVWETLFYLLLHEMPPNFPSHTENKAKKKRISKRTHEHYYFRVNFLFLYITKKNSSLLDETLL